MVVTPLLVHLDNKMYTLIQVNILINIIIIKDIIIYKGTLVQSCVFV